MSDIIDLCEKCTDGLEDHNVILRTIPQHSALPGTPIMTRPRPSELLPASLTPLNDHLIIEQDPFETTTASGLHLPSNREEKIRTGVILARGPGAFCPKTGTRLPLQSAVGDRVVFNRYAVETLPLSDRLLVILRERDLLCILPPSPDPEPSS